MLRQIIRPTRTRVVLELPEEYVVREIGILAFRRREVQAPAASAAKKAYPLRGQPVTYLQPFASVAEDDWQALP